MGNVQVANISFFFHSCCMFSLGIHGLGDNYYFILDEDIVLEHYHHPTPSHNKQLNKRHAFLTEGESISSPSPSKIFAVFPIYSRIIRQGVPYPSRSATAETCPETTHDRYNRHNAAMQWSSHPLKTILHMRPIAANGFRGHFCCLSYWRLSWFSSPGNAFLSAYNA